MFEAIIVSKMASYCAGTVQVRGVRKRDKKVRCDLRREQKMEREGAAVTCDGSLFHTDIMQKNAKYKFCKGFNSEY